MLFLKNWIHKKEISLSKVDKNRSAEDFDWGLSHLSDLDTYLPDFPDIRTPEAFLEKFTTEAINASEDFFTPTHIPEYKFSNNWLTFKSTVQTPYLTNNTVYARYFPTKKKKLKEIPPAVIVLPQWNGDNQSHFSLCHLLNKFGMTAIRLSLPYHDSRKPPDQLRADYMVSPNVGRTIQACRQAVHDVHTVLSWLETQGYDRVGIVGTSIGSCIGFLSYVHDPRILAGSFNHVSSYFADAVWTGISTSHIYEKLKGHITRTDLRRYWSVISPQSYIHRLSRQENILKKTFLISAKYDLTFLPHLSRQIASEFERQQVPYKTSWLPCGHYTSGQFPFNFYDAYLMVKHLYSAFS